MILEVSFCGHVAPLLFNPSVRQNTMLESLWWSKALYSHQPGEQEKKGQKGRDVGREADRETYRQRLWNRSFKGTLLTIVL